MLKVKVKRRQVWKASRWFTVELFILFFMIDNELQISSFHEFTAMIKQTVSNAPDVLRCILLVPGSDANIHSNSYASFALVVWTAWCVAWGGICAYHFLKGTWQYIIINAKNNNRSVLEALVVSLWTSLSLKNLRSLFKHNWCVCCLFYAYPEHDLTDCEKVFTKKEIKMTEQLVGKLVDAFGMPRLLSMLHIKSREDSEGVVPVSASKTIYSSKYKAMASKVAEETNELEHDFEMIDIETIYGPSNKDDAGNLCSTKQGLGEDKDSEGTDFELVNNFSQSEKLSNSVEVKLAGAKIVKLAGAKKVNLAGAKKMKPAEAKKVKKSKRKTKAVDLLKMVLKGLDQVEF